MLDDRYYMRREGFNTRRSATFVLLILLFAIYVLQLICERWFSFPIRDYFALTPEDLARGKVWQLITFQFLHGGWLHLLVNCWALYMFGKELEETLGTPRYLALYFSSGILGGLLQAMAGLFVGGWFGGQVVGASAGVFGLVAAFASLNPERPLTLLLFFIIPVNMRAKFLLLFSAIIALLGILFPGDGIAHAAHLGGMIGGMAFVKHALSWNLPRIRIKPRSPRLVRVPSNSQAPPVKAPPVEPPPEDFLSKEVDPILDKISAHGIQSLTERERQILESARRKIGRRI